MVREILFRPRRMGREVSKVPQRQPWLNLSMVTFPGADDE